MQKHTKHIQKHTKLFQNHENGRSAANTYPNPAFLTGNQTSRPGEGSGTSPGSQKRRKNIKNYGFSSFLGLDFCFWGPSYKDPCRGAWPRGVRDSWEPPPSSCCNAHDTPREEKAQKRQKSIDSLIFFSAVFLNIWPLAGPNIAKKGGPLQKLARVDRQTHFGTFNFWTKPIFGDRVRDFSYFFAIFWPLARPKIAKKSRDPVGR